MAWKFGPSALRVFAAGQRPNNDRIPNWSIATFLMTEYQIDCISIDRRGGALIPVVQSAVQLGFFFADAEFLGRRQDRTTIASLIKSSSEYVA